MWDPIDFPQFLWLYRPRSPFPGSLRGLRVSSHSFSIAPSMAGTSEFTLMLALALLVDIRICYRILRFILYQTAVQQKTGWILWVWVSTTFAISRPIELSPFSASVLCGISWLFLFNFEKDISLVGFVSRLPIPHYTGELTPTIHC